MAQGQQGPYPCMATHSKQCKAQAAGRCPPRAYANAPEPWLAVSDLDCGGKAVRTRDEHEVQMSNAQRAVLCMPPGAWAGGMQACAQGYHGMRDTCTRPPSATTRSRQPASPCVHCSSCSAGCMQAAHMGQQRALHGRGSCNSCRAGMLARHEVRGTGCMPNHTRTPAACDWTWLCSLAPKVGSCLMQCPAWSMARAQEVFQ
jgi:hypothetical protein